MISIDLSVRVVQRRDKKKYLLSNPKYSGIPITISKFLYQLLREINLGKYKSEEELTKKAGKAAVDYLRDHKIICQTEKHRYNQNILEDCGLDYPLLVLTIDLTNSCNLKCIHCYGKYGEPSHVSRITLSDIIEMKNELDKLHTIEVRLSGGECFLNPEFEEIALYFLENGFKVSIYTNATITNKVLSFIEKTKEYHFFMGISLDGCKEIHNGIRQDRQAFQRTVDLLHHLKDYPNIDILIATAVMKQNYDSLDEIVTFVKNEFPKFSHKCFITTPVDDNEFSFDYSFISEIKAKYPFLLEDYYSSDRKLNARKNRRHRCMGGVENAALTSDFKLKICPIAFEDEFILGDTKQSSLYDVWVHPNPTVAYFRSEYMKSMPQCKKCRSRKKCGAKNCRIEALRFTGNSKNANPYACMAVKDCYI